MVARLIEPGKTTYHIIRDTPLDLRALLAEANLTGRAVVVDATVPYGVTIGIPMTVTMERLTLLLADGGTVRMPLWEIDRVVARDCATEAA